MEPAHRGEVGGEAFGVSDLQLLDEELYVGGNEAAPSGSDRLCGVSGLASTRKRPPRAEAIGCAGFRVWRRKRSGPPRAEAIGRGAGVPAEGVREERAGCLIGPLWTQGETSPSEWL